MKTLGEFYKEKVLSRDDLIEVELQRNIGDIRIEKDLFGWKLYSGKEFVNCRSEEEARFLKVFFEIGVMDICVPRDNEYLKSILPELEILKKETDEIIEMNIDGILSTKLRERLRSAIYMELMYEDLDD